MVEVGSISLLVGLRAVLLFLSAFAAMNSTAVGDKRRVEVHLGNVLYIGQPLILLERPHIFPLMSRSVAQSHHAHLNILVLSFRLALQVLDRGVFGCHGSKGSIMFSALHRMGPKTIMQARSQRLVLFSVPAGRSILLLWLWRNDLLIFPNQLLDTLVVVVPALAILRKRILFWKQRGRLRLLPGPLHLFKGSFSILVDFAGRVCSISLRRNLLHAEDSRVLLLSLHLLNIPSRFELIKRIRIFEDAAVLFWAHRLAVSTNIFNYSHEAVMVCLIILNRLVFELVWVLHDILLIDDHVVIVRFLRHRIHILLWFPTLTYILNHLVLVI